MDDIDFPKRRKIKKKGLSGQTYFQHFVIEQLECIFHPIPEENDFGIDGYIEIVENDKVTGRLLGVQIKHGNSFFKRKTIGGYKYYGKNKHLNYYLNNNSPILIILLDENFNNNYWMLFDIAKTSQTENGWWLEVPIKNILNKNVYNKWKNIAGPAIDYQEKIKLNWRIDELIQGTEFSLIYIPKEEIEAKRYDFLMNFFNRITKNKEMMLKSRSSLDIFFPEYDDDPREIFEIPEIMEWLFNSIEIGIPWFYFLNHKGKSTALKLLFHSFGIVTSITRKEKGNLIIYSEKDFPNFLERIYINLNKFTEENDISLEINKEISAGIFDYFNRELVQIDQ